MVWEGNSGGVGPSGSKVYSNQSIDGSTWNVYWQGGGPLSFLRTSNSGSGSSHLGTFFRWGASKGYFSSGGNVGGVGMWIRNLRIGQLAYLDHEQLLHRNLSHLRL